MTFDELEAAVADPVSACGLFGADAAMALRQFRIIAHPDANRDKRDRAEALTAALTRLAADAAKPPKSIKSAKQEYILRELIGIGDVADVFRAESGGKEYAFKICRVPDGVHLLDNERAHLVKLLSASKTDVFSQYLPTLADSFTVKDRIVKRVNVFMYEPGWFTLGQVSAKHPNIGGRHIAWIFKRLLAILGFAHKQGIIHGAITPDHVMIAPKTHALRLVGWGHSVETGAVLTSAPAKYLPGFPPEVRDKKPATPATDIHQAAACMRSLAPRKDDLPEALQRFLAGCILDAPRMRPDDAWKLQDELTDLLKAVYGPPKFVTLSMP